MAKDFGLWSRYSKNLKSIHFGLVRAKKPEDSGSNPLGATNYLFIPVPVYLMELKDGASLKDVQEYVKAVLRERGFDDETIVEKCLLLGEEIGELYKAVRKAQGVKCDDNSKFGKVEHELADIMMYVIDIANKFGIDLEEAFRSKEEVNKQRSWK